MATVVKLVFYVETVQLGMVAHASKPSTQRQVDLSFRPLSVIQRGHLKHRNKRKIVHDVGGMSQKELESPSNVGGGRDTRSILRGTRILQLTMGSALQHLTLKYKGSFLIS